MAKKEAKYEVSSKAAFAILGVLLIMLAIVSGLSLAQQLKGPVFTAVTTFICGISGGFGYFVCILLAWLGLICAFSAGRAVSKRAYFLVLLLFFVVLGIVNLLSRVDVASFMDYVKSYNESSALRPNPDSYGSMLLGAYDVCGTKAGCIGKAAGLIGMLLAWPVWKLAGIVFGTVILILVGIVIILTCIRFNAGAAFSNLRQSLQHRREEKAQEQERKAYQQQIQEQERIQRENESRRISPAYQRNAKNDIQQLNYAMSGPFPGQGSNQASAPAQAPYPVQAQPQSAGAEHQVPMYEEVIQDEPHIGLWERLKGRRFGVSSGQAPAQGETQPPEAVYGSASQGKARMPKASQSVPQGEAAPLSPVYVNPRDVNAAYRRPSSENRWQNEQPDESIPAENQSPAQPMGMNPFATRAGKPSVPAAAEPVRQEQSYGPFDQIYANPSKAAPASPAQPQESPEKAGLSWQGFLNGLNQINSGNRREEPSNEAAPEEPAPMPVNEPSSVRPADLIRHSSAEQQSNAPVQASGISRAVAGLPQERRNSSAAYIPPKNNLLNMSFCGSGDEHREEDTAKAAQLEKTLKSFGIPCRVERVTHGPAVTRFELGLMESGINVKRIQNLDGNIALDMAANGSVRIEIPIPGTNLFGIEIPNMNVESVSLSEVLFSPEMQAAKSPLTVALGKDISGTPVLCDLAKMPHLLIAGQTGSGKSVCINAIITSLIYRTSPKDVRFIMVDPKVVELQGYNGIPHLLTPVVSDPHKAAGVLTWVVAEMMDRYHRMQLRGVRELTAYNEKLEPDEEKLPRIVVIIDELSDLMQVCRKEVEDSIIRIAQLARAAGIHLVLATQRPTVNVITGLIKANVPSRIAFSVASNIDSRTILDQNGAEKLLGKGDMFYFPTGAKAPMRVQGCFLSDSEIERIVNDVKSHAEADYDPDVTEAAEKAEGQSGGAVSASLDDSDGGSVDPQLADAIEIVVEANSGSISLLQRRLSIGHGRAGRLMDMMEERGIVGPDRGSKPRKVLITPEEYQQLKDSLL